MVKSFLFISTNPSRGLYLLGRELHKLGFSVTVAAPKRDNLKYWLWGDFIRLRSVGKFFLHRKFNLPRGTKVFAFDDMAANIAKRAGLRFKKIKTEIGLDLKIWAPGAVTAAGQNRILNEFGIAPYQKMITVISPLGFELDKLLYAVSKLKRDDFVVALVGKESRFNARKILNKISKSPARERIICTGEVQDLATFLRVSGAILSLGNHSPRLLQCAVAMARPTVWGKESPVRPNIELGPDLEKSIEQALDLKVAEIEKIEVENIKNARNFSVENTVKLIISE